jgi:hypothetical protein
MYELLEAKPTVIFVYGKEAPFLFNFKLLFELPLHILVWTSVGLVSGFEDIRRFLVLGLFLSYPG